MSRRIVIEERCSDNKWPCQCARTILTEPSEEMVERAAQSYLEDDLLAYGWDDAPLQVKEKYRIMARAALSAALFSSPVLAAEREEGT
jgi:hypothetical protein